jgi:hypothetical protein
MQNELLVQIKSHWQELRGRTYDLLETLQDADLQIGGLFPESQSLYYQLWCMLGMTESLVLSLADGGWGGRSCSLNADGVGVTIEDIRQALLKSDKCLWDTLNHCRLLDAVDGSSRTPLSQYFYVAEHEAQHHGQIINIIYANQMEIPFSWAEHWGLRRHAFRAS